MQKDIYNKTGKIQLSVEEQLRQTFGRGNMHVAANVGIVLATLTLCNIALQLSTSLSTFFRTSFTSHLVHGLQATSGMQAVYHPQWPVQPYLNR